MKQTEVKENWNVHKRRLKQKFALLTDNYLIYEEGKREEMFGKLQKKFGKTREEINKIIK